jgi:hypothetical protein
LSSRDTNLFFHNESAGKSIAECGFRIADLRTIALNLQSEIRIPQYIDAGGAFVT